MATSAVYPNTTSSLTDSSAQTTSYSYDFDSLAPTEITTTLPAVTDQGGGSTEDSTTESFNTLGWLTDSIDAAGKDTSFSYDPATGFQIGMSEQLGDDESPISTSATDDIYGRPHFEVDADGNTSTISYSR